MPGWSVECLACSPCREHSQLCPFQAMTPVMCAFDKAWIEAIDPARHGFRFDRATTIGYGGSHCPFHFTRTRSGPAAT